jgi:hypothetical protein
VDGIEVKASGKRTGTVVETGMETVNERETATVIEKEKETGRKTETVNETGIGTGIVIDVMKRTGKENEIGRSVMAAGLRVPETEAQLPRTIVTLLKGLIPLGIGTGPRKAWVSGGEVRMMRFVHSIN